MLAALGTRSHEDSLDALLKEFFTS